MRKSALQGRINIICEIDTSIILKQYLYVVSLLTKVIYIEWRKQVVINKNTLEMYYNSTYRYV